jgi:Ca-activated chloride channel family protein
MRSNLLPLLLLLLFAGAGVEAQELIALDVNVEARGKGATGTVVVMTVRIAPEDLAIAGDRLRLRATISSFGEVIDNLETEVPIDAAGVSTVYREWPPGSYDLRVTVSSLARPVIGLSSGQVEIPQVDVPFEPPEQAIGASAIEITPPKNDALHFVPIPDLDSLAAFPIEVVVPHGTASVEFYRDSRLFDRRKRPPWSIRIPTRSIIQRSEFRAIALDAMGRYLGEDVIVVNSPSDETGIEILVAPKSSARKGGLSVAVAVTTRTNFQKLSLHLDDVMVARWQACPCVTEIDLTDLQNAALLSAEIVDSEGNRFVEVSKLGGGFGASVRVDLVELQVQVFDSHNVPVTGLDPRDFSVYEDGRKIEIDGFGTPENQPLSLVLAVDSSGSMAGYFSEVRAATTGFAENLLIRGDRAALIRFAANSEILVSWSGDPADIGQGLADVVPGGDTSLNDAVIHSLMEIRGERGRKALVLLTDGADTSSFATFADTKWFSHSMRIPIYPITLFNRSPHSYATGRDIGDVTTRHRVASLADESGGRAFFRIRVDKLPAVYQKISAILRSQYVLWYRPDSDKAVDKFRSIKVKVAGPNYKVRTISGYYPGG